MAKIIKYASTLEQIKDSRFQTNDWSNLNNAVGGTTLSTNSTFTSRDGGKFVPAQLYAHDFDIDLPEQYILHNIDVEVKIKGSIPVKVPKCYFTYGFGGHPTTGTYGSDVFYDQPDANLSDSYNTINYNMNWSEITQYQMTEKKLESDVFGVVLQFDAPSTALNGTVNIEWIRVTIDYEEPEYIIEIDGKGKFTKDSWAAKYTHKVGWGSVLDVTIKVHSANSHITPNPKTVDVKIPLGLHIQQYSTSSGASFNPNTSKLSLDWSKGVSPYLNLKLHCRYGGLKELSVIGDNKIGSLSRYVFVEKGRLHGDDNVAISSRVVRRWYASEFFFVVRSITEDTDVLFDIHVDGRNMSDNRLVEWKFDKINSSDGVSFKESSGNHIAFNVPSDKEVEIHFSGVFLPKTTGDNFLVLETEDGGNTYEYQYTALEPYTYTAEVYSKDGNNIKWTNARLVTQVETGAYVYPTGVEDYDAYLIQDKPTLQVQRWDEIDYIGCVPLEQTHFKPKSTYKDTLLDTTYKNKTYMGKKGAIDETIALNVRLRPPQVSTMQGLVAMDKPVPINANHRCFESDALNHRGWAELYGIVTEPVGNNGLWYECQLSVKYITHNLNTRFLINKGSRISDYFLPELMTVVQNYGDDISEKFFIETNGGFTYNKSGTDYHMRNMFSLPYGRKFKVKGMNKLSIKSQVNFNWYSTRNVENTENRMSRIIKLIDAESGNAVLEYEYYDIDFSRTYEYNCRVICRVLHKGAYKTILNRNLILNYDAEDDPLDSGSLANYGSELIFKINNDKVTIQDCGLSGKELYIEDIDIQNGQYYFDVEFANQNIEHDSVDIINWLDIEVQELDYTSLYSNFYKNILVSPFPVPNKDVVFTRDSEEGTIYYLLDDGTECSYMINPYYQYHCGVDLQSKEGISIFNLDNNYKVIYIVNGLVKLGINRYTGRMTLYKYDKYSKQYIPTNVLQLTKYEDMNINSFTDDKLELQVSDTILTMWRGRPYIHIAHETEDILFNNKFTKIYADGVGDGTSNVTKMWNLIDTTNLLPQCLASEKYLDANCWDITESDVDDWSYLVTIDIRQNGGLADNSIISADFHLYDPSNTTMNFIIDGKVVDGVVHEGEGGETHRVYYKFRTEGTHTIRAVYYKQGNYYLSQKVPINIVDNGYSITPLFPSTMYYMQDDFIAKLTYAKNPVPNDEITFYVNGLTYAKPTDENGIARLNNRLPPNAESQGRSQEYDSDDNVYNVHMQHSEGGNIVATADKQTKILKGAVSITLETYDRNNNKMSGTRVKQGGYVKAIFTNNLDPEDDDIEPNEIYLKNKPVTLSINGREYARVTNNTGEARLNINLLPQSYDLKIAFGGDMQYNGTIKNYELKVEANE